MNNIFALSPLDGRYADKVSELSLLASEYGLIYYRVKVEIEWFKLLFTSQKFGLPKLDMVEVQILDNIINNFDDIACRRIKEIEQTTNHDVKAVEYYIKEQIVKYPNLHSKREFIHFAATSEDINNLSYGLMLKDIRDSVLLQNLDNIAVTIYKLAITYKDIAIISRTHGQSATPSTMGKECYNVYYRLNRQLELFKKQEILGKFNGAVGSYNAHMIAYPEVDWREISRTLVEDKLGLSFNPITTQIEPHDYVAEYMHIMCRINAILLDFNRDLWGYIAFGYFKQRVVAGEIGSSTMPHKVNPIDFENSEGNLGVANSIAIHLAEKLPISRFQRDLSDSTVLRNIGIVAGYSLLAYKSLLKGLNKLEINENQINYDLDNNWELLAEPIQTVLRKLGVENAYEQLKELTRGKKVDKLIVQQFIQDLNIPEAEKDKLLELTPHNYIGLAAELVI